MQNMYIEEAEMAQGLTTPVIVDRGPGFASQIHMVAHNHTCNSSSEGLRRQQAYKEYTYTHTDIQT